ncbi:MAG: hypothetical protein JXJ20_15580 [Anaerolineae bacterium]|jgi:hypothetical protein|nr:hypothetical protein [Anaerolineae bacterium]
MATNASTWFYAEPEHQAYLIEERVNHTLWSHRISAIYLGCTSEEPPFRLTGEWRGAPVTLEWVPNDYLTLYTKPGSNADLLIVGIKEILGLQPTISYVDLNGQLIVEWHAKQADHRLQEIQGNPKYSNITRYNR